MTQPGLGILALTDTGETTHLPKKKSKLVTPHFPLEKRDILSMA